MTTTAPLPRSESVDGPEYDEARAVLAELREAGWSPRLILDAVCVYAPNYEGDTERRKVFVDNLLGIRDLLRAGR